MNFIPFPDCARDCDCVEHFGVGECESICPNHFHKDGTPVSKSEHDTKITAIAKRFQKFQKWGWIQSKLEKFCAKQIQVRTQHKMMQIPISAHFRPQVKIYRCPEFIFKLASRLEFWVRNKIRNTV